ncbi:TniQ family protein [Paraburkholderia bannensis]|uniref:TniQ family protein n=1 Tax=Paraburkholderia bannensis TaxID=765414 RepID=UPI002AC31CD1|nr:TniQ family protein [Paraburkholderia bannensis]
MRPAASLSPQRSTTLLKAPRFPILTVDERKLTPALGYVFNRKWLDPCESLVSILWKFEKANGLPGHVVARLLGPDVDPYDGVVPQLGAVDIDRLHESLRVPAEALRTALLPAIPRRRYSSVFRFCRRCVGHGYHSVLHQMESNSLCPAHGRVLDSACETCGYEAPYRVNVRILEAPFHCAYCGASYGGQGWTPGRAPWMTAEHRKAFTRQYFQRYFG